MKKISYMLAAFAAVATLTTSCSSDEELVQNGTQEGKTISLTLEATRGEEAATRTAISYNDQYASLESKWAEGDKIYVYSQRTGEKLGVLTQTGDIINQKSSATAQNETSYATFSGNITLGTNDQMSDTYSFIYQGANDTEVTVEDGKLTYDLTNATSSTVAGLAKYDIAMAEGKIQGTADDDNKVSSASASVSFSNRLAVGYFTTDGLGTDSKNVSYYSTFTLDVKTGTITGVAGDVTIPGNTAFYMPLIPGDVNMASSTRTWSKDSESGKWGYTDGGISQSISFKASAGYYYRLGKTSNYGPVPFQSNSSWQKYETISGTYSVASDKTVKFTQGNLQYINGGDGATNDYWMIAPSQYSYLGSGATGNPTSLDDNGYADGSYDLFSWGQSPETTGDNAGKLLGKTDNSLYTGGQSKAAAGQMAEANDWGTKFAYGSTTGTTLYAEAGYAYPCGLTTSKYRTLTKDEWVYLLTNTSRGDARYAFCKVTVGQTTVSGIVIFPDNTTADKAKSWGFTGELNSPSATAQYTNNQVNQSAIDNNGLVFLPAAGDRNGASIYNVGSYGYYWSSTAYSATYAYSVRFYAGYFIAQSYNGRYYGCSVRLVQDNQ